MREKYLICSCGMLLLQLWTLLHGIILCKGDLNNAPAIVTKDGHLFFTTASDKNISFQVTGRGKVFLGTWDMDQVASMLRTSESRLASLDTSKNEITNRLQSLQTALMARASKDSLAQLRTDFSSFKDSTSTLLRNMTRQVSSLRSQVRRMKRRSDEIVQNLNRNECADSHCQNGATCIPHYLDYTCLCMPGWMGRNCDEDINECVTLADTVSGCQNGATCLNTPDGFECQCPTGFDGVLCDKKMARDCSGGSHEALCGHGTCIPSGDGHACRCDEGWRKSNVTQKCTVDKNECNEGRHPCSENPFVQCINIPGSFICDHCPVGYQGNGFRCQDINECEQSDTCRSDEICQNTVGSYQCSCPSGKVNRNGVCQIKNPCEENHGGCHPVAQCLSSPFNDEGRICNCPTGYIGGGVGAQGCTPTSALTPTYSQCVTQNLCINNGTCLQVNTNEFRCQCLRNYTGDRCQSPRSNPCQSQPCLNNGVCSMDSDFHAYCSCQPNFVGSRCEHQLSECGDSITGGESTVIFNASILHSQRNCRYEFSAAQEQIIELKFTQVQLRSPSTSEYIEVTETVPGDNTPFVIKRLSGSMTDAFNSSSNRIIMILYLKDSEKGNHGFVVRYRFINPSAVSQFNCCACVNGQTHRSKAVSGVFASPGYPNSYPPNVHCSVEVTRPYGETYRLELVYGSIQLGQCDTMIRDRLMIFASSGALHYIHSCMNVSFPSETLSGFQAVFFSNDKQGANENGFRLTWNVHPSEREPCGGFISATSGTLELPNVSQSDYVDCSWVITHGRQYGMMEITTNESIPLVGCTSHSPFLFFSTYVDVFLYNGDKQEHVSDVLSSCNLPMSVIYQLTSDAPHVVIQYLKPQNRQDTYGGRHLHFKEICGEIFTFSNDSESRVIRTPNYPINYEADVRCHFSYSTNDESAKYVMITFSDFDMNDDSVDCQFDYIQIKNERYCNGKTVPESLTLPLNEDNNFVMDIYANATVHGRGVFANVTFLECGGSYVIKAKQTFEYPEKGSLLYQENKFCKWKFTAAANETLFLKFIHFHLESSYGGVCRYDYVEIFVDDVSYGKHCHVNLPPNFSGGSIVLVFVSDSSRNGHGFEVTVEPIPANHLILRTYTEFSGQFSGPPEGNYEKVRQIIELPAGFRVLVNISLASHEDGSFIVPLEECNRRQNYLDIELTENHGIAYCLAHQPTETLRSISNSLTLEYHNYNMRNFRYTISYTSESTTCGNSRPITRPSVHLVNPSYPRFDNLRIHCQEVIQFPPGNHISITGKIYFDCEFYYSPRIQIFSIETGNRKVIHQKYQCGMNAGQVNVDLVLPYNKILVEVTSPARYSLYGGGIKYLLNIRKVCDVIIEGIEGTITSFGNPLQPEDCQWKLTASLGNQIELTMHLFDLPPANDSGICDRASLMISKPLDQQPLLPTSCGNTQLNMSQSFSSSISGSLIMKYSVRSRDLESLNYQGFRATYKTTGCVHYMREMGSGDISSPMDKTNPNQYAHNINCFWIFRAPAGFVYKLRFTMVDMENSESCQYDAIELYNTLDYTYSSPFKVFCHLGDSQEIIVTSQFGKPLLVRMRTDILVAGRGFTATYEAIHSAGCGGEFKTSIGNSLTIHASNEGSGLEQCRWDLSVPPHHGIQMNITELHLPTSDFYCSKNNLTTREIRSDRLATEDVFYCPNSYNFERVLHFPSNELIVKLNAPNAESNREIFKAEITPDCGEIKIIQRQQEGFLQSPHYPNSEPSFFTSECQWLLQAPDDSEIDFWFTSLRTDGNDDSGGLNQNCSITVSDYVTIYDGSTTDSPLLGCFFRHTDHLSHLRSSGNTLLVVFKKSSSRDTVRMQAKYAVETSTCGGEYDGSAGYITTPHYEQSVSGPKSCRYIIRSTPASNVVITQIEFQFNTPDDSETCDYGSVIIYEGNPDDPVISKRFCRSENAPSAPVTLNENATVEFVLNSDQSSGRLKFHYEKVYGGVLTGSRGIITSPNYPGHYDPNTDVSWIIEGPIGTYIRLELTDVNLEQLLSLSGGCWDYVALFDGDVSTGTRMARRCTMPLQDEQNVWMSSSNVAAVHFYSDQSVQIRRGFSLKWSISYDYHNGSALTCQNRQVTVDSEGGYIISPNYGQSGYHHNLKCDWTFAPLDQRRGILFDIVDFQLETSANCVYDALKVPGGYFNMVYSNGSRIRKYYLCGQVNGSFSAVPPKLMFISDGSVQDRGFKIHFGYDCTYFDRNAAIGGEVTNLRTNSTNGPTHTNCYVGLFNYAEGGLNIKFTEFHLPTRSNGSCYAYLTFAPRGYATSNEAEIRLCGTNLPSPISKSWRRMVVRYTQPPDSPPSYFRFSYRSDVSPCGSTINLIEPDRKEFTLSSASSVCQWIVHAPHNRRVRFVVDNSSRAGTVKLYDGNDKKGLLLSFMWLFPSVTIFPPVYSMGSSMFIQIQQYSYRRQNFSATVNIAECGGSFHVKENVNLHLGHELPTNQENLLCEWHVKSDPNHFITVSLGDFSMPQGFCNPADLLIYDGFTDNDTLLYSHCNNNDTSMTSVFNSSTSELLIRVQNLSSSIRIEHLRIRFSQSRETCGGVLTLRSGSSSTLYYPSNYPRQLYCKWIIQAREGFAVRVQILDADFGNIENCAGSYLLISNIDRPWGKRWCMSNLHSGQTFTSTGRQMYLIFNSRKGRAGRGLSFNYTTTDVPVSCGQMLSPNLGNVNNFLFNNGTSVYWGNFSSASVTNSQLIDRNVYGLFCEWNFVWDEVLINRTISFWTTGPLSRCTYQDQVTVIETATQHQYEYCSGGDSQIPPIYSPSGYGVRLIYSISTSDKKTGNGTFPPLMIPRWNAYYTFEDCGGVLTEDSGSFTSPNYPNQYPNMTRCVWLIRASKDQRINLKLTEIHLEEGGANCMYDRLEIRTGSLADSDVLVVFCGSNATNAMARDTFHSIDNEMRITFLSDSTIGAKGFVANYTFLDVNACGGTRQSQQGELTSPNYPNLYPNNEDCDWLIAVKEGYLINANFDGIYDLGNDQSNCGDYIDVFDSDQSVSMEHFCGNVRPTKPISSSKNRMTVRFVSNSDIQNKGFKLKWVTECGETFSDDSGTITTPQGNDDDWLRCSYKIVVPRNRVVYLYVISFDSLSSQESCGFSNVTIQKYSSMSNSWYTSQTLCNRGYSMQHTGNVTVIVSRAGYYFDSHFSAFYRIFECGGNYTAMSGSFSLTDDNIPYSHHLSCLWNIQGRPQQMVYLEISQVDIEGLECRYDYLVVNLEGNASFPANSTSKRICDVSDRIYQFTSSEGNGIAMKFVSDSSHSLEHRGFTASYQITPGPSVGCGGFINLSEKISPTDAGSSEGSIHSVDLNNDGRYDAGQICSWTFLAHYKMAFMFWTTDVIEIYKENDNDVLCATDSLKIVDGEGGKILGRFCGNSTIADVRSESNEVFVTFRTSPTSHEGRGWSLFYRLIDAGCLHRMNVTNEIAYLPVTDASAFIMEGGCKWNLLVSDATSRKWILVMIHQLELGDNSEHCSEEFLRVTSYNVSNTDRNFDWVFCKSIQPNHQIALEFLTNRVTVKLDLPADVRRHMNVSTQIETCNRSISLLSGHLRSYGRIIGESYLNMITCQTRLIAPQADLKYQFYFYTFSLEYHPMCRYDYFELSEGNSSLSDKLCGNRLPPSLVSNTSSVAATFVSDFSVSRDGYDVIFIANESICGGVLYSGEGALTSPYYGSGREVPVINCYWTVYLPGRRSVSITLLDVELGNVENEETGTSNCPTTYLQISSSQTTILFCNKASGAASQPIVWNVHHFNVQFYTSNALNATVARGFRLQWKTTTSS